MEMCPTMAAHKVPGRAVCPATANPLYLSNPRS